MRVEQMVWAALLLLCASCNLNTLTPTMTPTLTATLTTTPTLIPVSSAATEEEIVPAWVMEFADPILKSVSARRPDYHDEFSKNLNAGWFYFFANNETRYARLQNETLLLRLPEGSATRDLTVYHSRLVRENFVLSFDLKFEKTQPEDVFRIQFNQTEEKSVVFNIFKNRSWTMSWGSRADWKTHTGVYDYFSPEWINVLMIMRGNECAVYLNRVPLDYVGDCRSDLTTKLPPRALSFQLISSPDRVTIVTIDNVKFWEVGE